jgi:hypothetical protein
LIRRQSKLLAKEETAVRNVSGSKRSETVT